jgi:hypothetical protein
MKYLITLIFALSAFVSSYSQTYCTLSGTDTVLWVNSPVASQPACQEGGTAVGKDILVIPAGVTLSFDTNGDTWTGTRIDVYGTLLITPSGQTFINSSIAVYDGGFMQIDTKLNIGSTTGCGYTLILEEGATVNIQGGSPDRLNICGTEISRGGTAGCNPYPDGPLPYCEPSGGFTGPVGFDETGVNGTLPISLLSFDVSLNRLNQVVADWTTATEKNVSHFVIERSSNGKEFDEIGRVNANGNSSIQRQYSFTDDLPLVGRNYYRLKEVDFDGTAEHFNMKLMTVSGKKGVVVYPNPVLASEDITVSLNFSSDDKSYVRVTDVAGHEIKNFAFNGTSVSLPFKPGKGSYIVTVQSGGATYTTRFVVP